MADDTEAEQVAREVYRETAMLYREVRPQMRVQGDLWYEVLYGPPKPPPDTPDVVFVGAQPGGREGERFEEPARDRLWPQRMVHAEVPAPFPLARRLQLAFKADPALLSESTGLNAVFFRARNWRTWCEMVPDHGLRAMIERSCATMAKELIRAMRPRLVVAIGFSALRLLGSGGRPLPPPEGGRVLLREGEVAGLPSLAMHHPTPPAKAPSDAEMEWIGSEILRRLGRPRGAADNA